MLHLLHCFAVQVDHFRRLVVEEELVDSDCHVFALVIVIDLFVRLHSVEKLDIFQGVLLKTTLSFV